MFPIYFRFSYIFLYHNPIFYLPDSLAYHFSIWFGSIINMRQLIHRMTCFVDYKPFQLIFVRKQKTENRIHFRKTSEFHFMIFALNKLVATHQPPRSLFIAFMQGRKKEQSADSLRLRAHCSYHHQ